jgi:hypothetical protein
MFIYQRTVRASPRSPTIFVKFLVTCYETRRAHSCFSLCDCTVHMDYGYLQRHFGESRLTGKKGPGAGTDSNLYACLVHRPLAAPACMHADAAVR